MRILEAAPHHPPAEGANYSQHLWVPGEFRRRRKVIAAAAARTPKVELKKMDTPPI
jgi:hypothetical protein